GQRDRGSQSGREVLLCQISLCDAPRDCRSMRRRRELGFQLRWLGLGVFLGGSVLAQPVAITNASFEQPSTPNGTFITGSTSFPAGWTSFGMLSNSPNVRHVGVLN